MRSGGGTRTDCPACGATNRDGARFCDACGSAMPAGPHGTTLEPRALADGRYEVVRFLGEGSRKRVYLACDLRLDHEVAVAVIETRGLDEIGLARVRREAKAMARLGDHPNIVTVHDITEEDDLHRVAWSA